MLRHRRGLLFGLSLILGPVVAAAPWTVVESPLAETRADFQITRYSEAAADGFWALGFVRSGMVAAKYDLDGNELAHATDISFSHSPTLPKKLSDGGVLISGSPHEGGYGCVVTKLANDGHMVWQTRVVPENDSLSVCGDIGLDAAGNIWVGIGNFGFGRIARLRFDGTVAGIIETSGQFGTAARMAADPVGAGIYVAGDRVEDAAGTLRTRAQVVRYHADGTVDWRWQTENPAEQTGVQLLKVSAQQGIVALYASEPSGFSSLPIQDWFAVMLQPTGAVRLERPLALNQPVSIAHMSSLDTQGAWLIFSVATADGSPGQLSVVRLRLDGSLVGSRSIDDAIPFCRELDCQPALRSDGGLWFFVTSAADNALHVAGIDANGVERTRVESGPALSVLPDDRVQTVTPRLQPLRVGFTQPPQLLPDTTAQMLVRRGLLAEAVAEDGASAQLFARDDEDGFLLRYKTALDSASTWQVSWTSRLESAPNVSISETLVCLAARAHDQGTLQLIVACWRRSDGSLFWEGGDDFAGINASASIRALSGGGVATLNVEPFRAATYRRLDSAGQLVVAVLVPELNGQPIGVSIGPTGDALLVDFVSSGNGSVTTMSRIDRDGNLRFRIPVPSESTSTFPRFAPDGSVLLFAGSAARYSADGQFLWRTGLLAQVWDAVTGDDTVWISLMRSAARPADDLVALDLATGALRWSHDLHGQSNERPQVELGAGNRLMVLQGQRSYLRWRVYDGADGTLRHEQTDGCGAVLCDLILLRRDGNGVARAWLDTFSASDGWGATLMQLPDAVADVPRIAADQDGVSGAWFAPWSNGQGLVIDWIAGARTLFAPWFTFSPSDPSDFFEYRTTADSVTADLHWFTLQGVVAPGATRADLALLSTDGGDFGVGIANAHQVGDASLEFESCDRAHLRYRFDPEVNDGAEGLITLTRLTPGVACATTTTTATVPTPSKRFDASFEGSWFDPASSGQGLMFTAIPAADTLFATWFTYDPAAAPDETTEQHWFTLQGPLGDGDQTTLAIVRTQGGSFDELPTTNAQQVGTAIVTRLGCDRAELRYQFDDNDIAASFRGLGGSQILSRIGGCE